jgi:SHS2 domain-containing protein
MPYRILDHTADFMVEVTASSREELFAEAARALMSALTDPEAIRAEESVSVDLEADDAEQLLVTWLTELLFLYESERWLFCRFGFQKLTERALEATACGEKLDPARHAIDREVKAVTYHQLKVEHRDGAWRTRLVFDL